MDKRRVQRLMVCRGTDLKQCRGVSLYFLKLSRWPSPESCRPQSSLITRAVILTVCTPETFIKQYKCVSTLPWFYQNQGGQEAIFWPCSCPLFYLENSISAGSNFCDFVKTNTCKCRLQNSASHSSKIQSLIVLWPRLVVVGIFCDQPELKPSISIAQLKHIDILH